MLELIISRIWEKLVGYAFIFSPNSQLSTPNSVLYSAVTTIAGRPLLGRSAIIGVACMSTQAHSITKCSTISGLGCTACFLVHFNIVEIRDRLPVEV